MAVAFDAVGPSSAGTGNGAASTLSWTHTIGAGVTNGYVLAGVAVTDANDALPSPTTVTCGGTAMTSLGKVHSNNSNVGYIQVFGLATGASTGAKTIAVTVAGSVPNGIEGGSISFSGVNQTTPVGTPATAFGAGTPLTAATAGSTSGNLVAGFGTAGNGITSATAPSTSRYINNSNANNNAAGSAAGATSPATGSAVTMAWAETSSDWWAEIIVEVLASGAAAPSGPPPHLRHPAYFQGTRKRLSATYGR